MSTNVFKKILRSLLLKILKIRKASKIKRARRARYGKKGIRAFASGRVPLKRAVSGRIPLKKTLFERIPLKTFIIAVSVFIAAVSAVLVITLTAKGQQGTQTAIANGVPVAEETPDISALRASVILPVIDMYNPETDTLKKGMSDPLVVGIQQRLMELNYMDEAEPTQLYGPVTKEGVILFQRQMDITVDGCLGQQTYSMLFAQDAPSYAVSLGDKGDDVQRFKDRLYELGYIDASSDTYDDTTKAAVVKFQQLNGLAPDGSIGRDTIEMLYSEDAKANYFSSGEKNEKILSCQKRLQKLGYLTTVPDGKYGADTVNAVKRFQELNGLIADGYLGPQTITVLNSKNAQSSALTIGMNGIDVTNVQQRLVELKYLSKSTGYYGSVTVNAVKAFQKQNKLTVDGKVGSQTMNVLLSDKAKTAPRTNPGNTGGSGDDTGGGTGGSGDNTGGGTGGSGDDTGGGSEAAPGEAGGVEKFISVAESKIGRPYVRGAKGPDKFDCSGFVYWCLNHSGVVQSYMTSAAWQKCTKYQRIEGMDNLVRGDVISFKGHVAIYMGDNKMIHAMDGVMISSNINRSSYWTRTFVCGFRIY